MIEQTKQKIIFLNLFRLAYTAGIGCSPRKLKGDEINIYQTNQEDWRHKGPDQTIREGNPTAVNKIEDKEEFLELITLKEMFMKRKMHVSQNTYKSL